MATSPAAAAAPVDAAFDMADDPAVPDSEALLTLEEELPQEVADGDEEANT